MVSSPFFLFEHGQRAVSRFGPPAMGSHNMFAQRSASGRAGSFCEVQVGRSGRYARVRARRIGVKRSSAARDALLSVDGGYTAMRPARLGRRS